MVKVSRLYRSVPGFRRVKRAWRSRGFGIHSPFAFRFITSVLRQRSPYYDYDRLRELAEDRKDFRRAALIFRLVCEFVPEAVVVSPDVPPAVSGAVSLADSRVRLIAPDEAKAVAGVAAASMLICGSVALNDVPAVTDRCAESGLIDGIFSRGGVVVLLEADRRTYLSITRRMKSGMSFTNRRTAIFFSRPDLPRQDFEVNF